MNQSLGPILDQVMPTVIASGLLVSLCTIQTPSTTDDAIGAPVGTYVDVVGLIDIPCTAPPEGIGTGISAAEMKEMQYDSGIVPLHVLLNDWYPQIRDLWLAGARAVIDGTPFDLMGSESDSQKKMTRLKLRILRP